MVIYNHLYSWFTHQKWWFSHIFPRFLYVCQRVYPPNGAIPAVPQHFAIPHGRRRIAQPAILLEGAYWAPGGHVEDARGAVAQHGPGGLGLGFMIGKPIPKWRFTKWVYDEFMSVWVQIMNFSMDYWFTLWWTNSLL